MSVGSHAIAPAARSGSERRFPAVGPSLAARWLRLLAGLWVFAAGLALMVRAELGLSSWDVLHDALDRLTPLTFGQGVIAVSVVVVLGSYALGVKPGPATLANMVLVGAFTDLILTTGFLSGLGSWTMPARAGALIAGVVVIALGTALYIGADLGAGPRDALMLAGAHKMHSSPGAARVVIEASVLAAGVLLGGRVGVGTLAFTVLIGPAINYSFRLLHLTRPPDDEKSRKSERARNEGGV